MTHFSMRANYHYRICKSRIKNRKHSKGFTRDECICIGFVYGIDVESLNELLRDNDHADLGLDDRDGIIRRCLSKGCSPEATNLALAEKGWPKLLQK